MNICQACNRELTSEPSKRTTKLNSSTNHAESSLIKSKGQISLITKLKNA